MHTSAWASVSASVDPSRHRLVLAPVLLGLLLLLALPAIGQAQIISPGPQVVEFGPAAGETSVGLNSDIWVRFDREMDSSTIDTSSFAVQRQVTDSWGKLIWLSIGGTVQDWGDFLFRVEPSAPLLPNTLYRVQLSTDIKDARGLHLPPGDWSWTFTTGAINTAPRVIASGPSSKGLWQTDTINYQVAVLFDRDIGWPDAHLLEFETNQRLPLYPEPKFDVYFFRATTYGAPNAYTFPTGGFHYQLVLERVTSKIGGVLMPRMTIPFVASDPPKVDRVFPSMGATSVPLNTRVQVTFNVPVDSTSLGLDGVHLREPSGSIVPATIEHLSPAVATITPSSALRPETKYGVWVSAGVKSEEGMPYEASWSWLSEDWHGVGGMVGEFTTAAETTVPTTPTTPTPDPDPDLSFPDVSSTHPHYDAIMGLAERDIVHGYKDGTFGPEDPVRRAQFAKIVVGCFGFALNEQMTSPFTDFGMPDDPNDFYPQEFVACAYAKGITIGTTPTTFSPWAHTTRAQVVTMVVRALQNEHPGLLVEPPTGYLNHWGVAFSPDHGENARIAEYNGLLEKLPLTTAAANPWEPMPRGEVAQVLWNMLIKMGGG